MVCGNGRILRFAYWILFIFLDCTDALLRAFMMVGFSPFLQGNASVTSAHEKVEIIAEQNPKEKMTAEQFRKRGNELHDVRRFQEAVECYTKAIVRMDTPSFFPIYDYFDKSIDRLIDWLIGRSIDWLIARWNDWLIDWLIMNFLAFIYFSCCVLVIVVTFFVLTQMKDGNIPTFYTNRALCYLRLQRWDLVCKDCSTAIERDGNCLKAYYFMGVAMMEKGNHDEAINLLQKGTLGPLLLVPEDEGAVFYFFNRSIDWLIDFSFFCYWVEISKTFTFLFQFSYHSLISQPTI